eukprot:gi/632953030/ref/XP_007892173.1/ PREDICTED: T-complex protein 1 subunit alpha [Callorhinchus milii]
MCDEMERSLHDALCVVKRVLESKSLVPGGGAVEAALSIYLENYATSLGSREQLAIAEFARAMLIIPRTLAVNAAQDSTDLVAKLRAFHNEAQVNPDRKTLKWIGLDLLNGKPRDNKQAGVFEPTMVKVKSLKFATEAAITILRIDDLIKLYPDEWASGSLKLMTDASSRSYPSILADRLIFCPKDSTSAMQEHYNVILDYMSSSSDLELEPTIFRLSGKSAITEPG